MLIVFKLLSCYVYFSTPSSLSISEQDKKRRQKKFSSHWESILRWVFIEQVKRNELGYAKKEEDTKKDRNKP